MVGKFQDFLTSLHAGDQEIKFYDLKKFGDKFFKLPFSIRVLLESALRNCDEFQVRKTFT
jgi:aconitate hydratase